MSREAKVGALVLAALAVLAVAVFLLGDRKNYFTLKNRYFVRFATVSGLAPGNPVQLGGVTVGDVDSVVLPAEIEDELLTVWISVNRRYAERIRGDSEARIKTFGLLGDKYVEITSGSPDFPVIPSGAEIPAEPATDVDQLIASGEDLVENVVAISVSLRSILARMEAGEGILGQLTTDDEAGQEAKAALVSILGSMKRVAGKVESGDGALAALVNDPSLVRRGEEVLSRLEAVLGRLEEGDGALPAMLNDPELRERLVTGIDSLSAAAEGLSELATELAEGEGLLKKMLADEEFGREVGEDLRRLIHNLTVISEKLEEGDGTLGKMINDPHVYEAIDDIVVGIDDSKLLRWMIRNRQRAGFKKKYLEEGPPAEAAPEPAAGSGAAGSGGS